MEARPREGTMALAVFDTHKTYESFKAGGFSESQAKTLLDALSESKE
ncbi:MAG: hypothetical protein OXK81_02705 [Chloroflexota bacterium]|nr:hypothetical protein [Chloroflexota bacterium]MDE2930131.1 hypothetical protein [Chloroflexota bacterium]